jgi:hypothetical protein
MKGEYEKVLERPSEMIIELGWKPLKLRRKVDRLTNFCRAWQGKDGWNKLHTTIKKDNRLQNTRKKHDNQVKVEGSKKDVGKFSFLKRTGNDWNELDGNIFNELGHKYTVKQLKNMLKRLFVECVFS